MVFVSERCWYLFCHAVAFVLCWSGSVVFVYFGNFQVSLCCCKTSQICNSCSSRIVVAKSLRSQKQALNMSLTSEHFENPEYPITSFMWGRLHPHVKECSLVWVPLWLPMCVSFLKAAKFAQNRAVRPTCHGVSDTGIVWHYLA